VWQHPLCLGHETLVSILKKHCFVAVKSGNFYDGNIKFIQHLNTEYFVCCMFISFLILFFYACDRRAILVWNSTSLPDATMSMLRV
jgi:hypothetical protein